MSRVYLLLYLFVAVEGSRSLLQIDEDQASSLLQSATKRKIAATKRRSSIKCDDDYASLSAGDTCTTTWNKLTKGSHQLRATEPALGHAWVVAEMTKTFSSAKATQLWLKEHSFPVVLRSNDFYLTDAHHHAAAIQLLDDKDIWDLDITLTVMCDYRSYSTDQFWQEMDSERYTLLINRPGGSPFALPKLVPAETLPTGWDLSMFTDDIWRSLAGFASHVHHVSDDRNRCFRKPCTFFLDFQWSYTMNYVLEVNQTLWPEDASSSAADFQNMFHKLSSKSSPKDIDLDAWYAAGESILPFCHSKAIQNFTLPADMFPDASRSGGLSGWSAVPVPENPECPRRTCNALAHHKS